jgi:hypothetical protein
VSLALPAGNPDGGTSSFFVNVGNNAGLDNQFTVMGAIADMTVINQIMALSTLDRTLDPVFGANPGNLAFTDVPIMDDEKQVFITRTFQVLDPMTIARAVSMVNGTMAASAAAAGSGGLNSAGLTGAIGVPEPTSLAALLIGSVSTGYRLRRRR